MISACPRCALLGLTISALVHVGIASAVLWSAEPEKIRPDAEHQVAVSLAMFAGPDGGDHQAEDGNPMSEQEPEPERGIERAPPSEPESIPEPDHESTPEQDSEAEPLPKPEPLPKLEPKPESKPKSAPKPRPSPKPKPKPKPKSKPLSKPDLKSKPATSPAPRRSADQRTERDRSGSSSGSGRSAGGSDKKSGKSNKALEQKYLAGLRRAIAKKRRYPASARRRGTTGVATVSFVIAQNGRISGTRVDKSSGSSVLDKAAVETLQRLGKYKPIPKALGRSRWSLRVPIRFALE